MKEKQEVSHLKAEFLVRKKEYITPHYIRVFLGGKDVPLFANTTIGNNNKILIPPKGVNTIYFPEYDYEQKQWKPQPANLKPIVRTYTHRGIDLEANELWIDFAVHGEEGPASAWAIHAKEGDTLGVMMKNGKIQLYPPAKHYLLVGDMTAIPVLAAILEDLPSSVQGTCIIEVNGKEDEQPLLTAALFNFIWLHNPDPKRSSLLPVAVRSLELPTADRSAYVAAEFAAVKEIRQYLRKEKLWSQSELYAYSYWKAGESEDKSAVDRQKEKSSST